MSVYLITAKKDVISSFKIEKGMNVEVICDDTTNPLTANSGKLVKEAFKKKYGFDPGSFCDTVTFDIKKL